MFHKKNIIKIISLLSFSVLIIFSYMKKNDNRPIIMKQVTYQIKNKKLKSHLTTKHEENKYNLVSNNTKIVKSKVKKTTLNIDLPQDEIKWKESLAKELLRFQKSTTKVFIKSVKKDYKPNQEVVIISYRTINNSTSFTASVNTQTGKIIETWGRTISESKAQEVTFRL